MESPLLTVRMFGGLDLHYGGAPLPPLGSGRAESLLAYLLINRHAPQSRQLIAYVLWPDSTEAQARTNLRHVLHILRKSLPEADRFVEVGARALLWRPDAPAWIDVEAFEEALARAADPAQGTAREHLEAATALYTADLLPGYYDDWVAAPRERLRQAHIGALERLAAIQEQAGDGGAAIRSAERLLRADPLNEGTYRILMRLHDTQGNRARALHVFHECTATLERELGVGPSPSTRAAYESLVVPGPAGPASGRAPDPDISAPMVGRLAEWDRLTGLWRQAERGPAQLAVLTGEPGIGKTRLVEELRAWCAHRGVTCAVARSYEAEGDLAFGPVVTWLRSQAFRDRLARRPPGQRRELARLVPDLVEADPPPPAPGGIDSEEVQRQRLFDAVVAVLAAPSRGVLLVADDLHRSDADTLQFLHYLLRAGTGTPLMVAATARSGETGPDGGLGRLLSGLGALGQAAQIEVPPMTLVETADLAGRYAPSTLDDSDIARLYTETGGNPLFVAETLRAGWPHGSDRVTVRIQGAVQSHVARLSEPARRLVALAATVGREFRPELLAAAGDFDESTVVRGVDELWRSRILREGGTGTYDFSHDIVREVVDQAMGPAQRAHAHLRVAQALEASTAFDAGAMSGVLAVHYEKGGAPEQAVRWYRRAAEAAQRMHANAEAVRLLERALAVVDSAGPGPDLRAERLAVLTALTSPLGAVHGYAAPRLIEVQEEALDLTRRLAVPPEAPLLRSLAIARLTRGDFEAARRFGRQLRARGESEGDGMLTVEARYVLGVAAFWEGAFEEARSHLVWAIDGYREGLREVHLSRFGQDPKVVCQGRLANTLWFLGHASEAKRASEASLALSSTIDHPYTQAVALVFAAILAVDSGEAATLLTCAGELDSRRGQGHGPQIELFTDALDGYIQVLDGHPEPGLARIESARGRAGRLEHAPGFDAVMARLLLAACDAADDADAGLVAAGQAIGAGPGSVVWEAEARRLRAEFLHRSGAPEPEVRQELQRALDLARRQGAAWFEQRVLASQARLAAGRRVG